MKNKRKIRYLKTSKAVLSAATALLTVSSIASSATSAAQVNEFRIVSDKNYAAAGDRINISVDLLPGDLGTTGFSFNLHFDPQKVSLIVPDRINESDFSVVSSYDAKKGIVRVVGAELSGENVTDDTRLNIASFTVLDDAVGEIGYWLDVDADVAFDGNNYINAAFKAPTSDAKYTVIGPEKHDISPRAKIPTQLLNEKYDRYNIDYLSDENDLIDDEYFSNVRDTSSAEEPVVVVIGSPDESSGDTSDSNEPLIEDVEKQSYSAENSSESNQNTIFTKTEDGQYSFNISDYITDDTGTYDIEVRVSSTGFVDGGIGMMNNNGNWDSSYCQTYYGNDTWTFENVKPSECWDQVFVQIYSMQEGAEFSIDDIKIISGGYNSDIVNVAPEPDDLPVSDEVQDNGDSSSISAEEPVEQETVDFSSSIETNDSSAAESEKSDEPEETSSVQEKKEVIEKTDNKNDAKTDEKAEMPQKGSNEEKAANDTNEVKTVKSNGDVKQINDKVDSEKKQADSSTKDTKANPNTGNRKENKSLSAIQIGAALIMVYSLFATIYNKAFAYRKHRS